MVRWNASRSLRFTGTSKGEKVANKCVLGVLPLRISPTFSIVRSACNSSLTVLNPPSQPHKIMEKTLLM